MIFILARELHKTPDEIRAMPYEDAVTLATLMKMEQDEIEQRNKPSTNGSTARLRKR